MLSFDLLHRDDVVVGIVIDEDDGRIVESTEPERMDLMPMGTVVNGIVRSDRLKSWWSSRSIPATRTGVQHLLHTLGLDDTVPLLPRSMGLSLTDPYRIRPQGSEACWRDVNFFANGFSDDMGNLLFGRDVRTDAFNPVSPDLELDS